MSVDVEERLRADLPRLADLLADQGDDAVYAPGGAGPVRRRRAGMLAVAAAVVIALVVAAVVLVDRSGGDGRRIRTAPAATAESWTALPDSGLGARENVAAVWTGSEVIVWGGNVGNLFFQNGAAYDPAAGSWRDIAPNQWAGPGTMSTWTGDRLVVVAKRGGAAYDPSADKWTDLPMLPDDVNSGFAGVVWSGADVFGAVWGESTLQIARLDEADGRWVLGAPQAAAGDVPAARGSGWAVPSVATWFDGEVYVWAGDHGWAYDPERDSWRRLPVLPVSGSALESVLTVADGHVVAVYASDGPQGRVVGVMRYEFGDWAPVTETVVPGFAVPVATGVGPVVLVVDATGAGAAVELALGTETATTVGGSPLDSSGGQASTWARDGLFVWGGSTSGAAEAAWLHPTSSPADARGSASVDETVNYRGFPEPQMREAILDRSSADLPDPIAWVGPNGTRVFVRKADWLAVLEANLSGRPHVMAPAVDEAGTLQGYAAQQVGFITKSVAEAPGFDLAKVIARARRDAAGVAAGALDDVRAP